MGLCAVGVDVGYTKKERVLRGITCEIRPGELTAIVGPNGAGKSTLLRVLSGVMRAWSGEVRLGERELASLKARERALRIAYAGQRVPERLSLTVREVVGFGRYAVGEDADALEAAMGRYELEELADGMVERLSVGQQQRVSIARADAQLGEGESERYLILDEPIASMDPRHAVRTMEALRRRCGQGVGVCVVLHDLTAVSRWAERVILLDGGGQLVCEGAADDVLREDVLEGVYGVRMVRADTPAGPVLVPMGEQGDRLERR